MCVWLLLTKLTSQPSSLYIVTPPHSLDPNVVALSGRDFPCNNITTDWDMPLVSPALIEALEGPLWNSLRPSPDCQCSMPQKLTMLPSCPEGAGGLPPPQVLHQSVNQRSNIRQSKFIYRVLTAKWGSTVKKYISDDRNIQYNAEIHWEVKLNKVKQTITFSTGGCDQFKHNKRTMVVCKINNTIHQCTAFCSHSDSWSRLFTNLQKLTSFVF